MPDARVDEARRQFPSAAAAIHFDHASVGPISVAVRDAQRAVLDEHLARGYQNAWRDDIERVRARAAGLVGSAPGNIAFTQNTSYGISLAANGIDWRPGDNVVLPEREFPSNHYPWLNLEPRGVELRRVAAPLGHATDTDIAAAIDHRTRAVTVSAVQYSSGHRYDLATLGALCRERGVLFVVDGTQSVGALTIDVAAAGIDVLAVSSHKWLLGPSGIGFAHVSDTALDQLRVDVVGWLSVAEPFLFDGRLDLPPSAARFEPGTENISGIVGLGATLGLIERFGKDWIEDRVLDLTDHLCASLAGAHCHVLSPRDLPSRSGIVIFRADHRDTAALHERLTAAGVKCAPRAGGIRFSPHYYNTVDEIAAALDVIR